MDFPLNMTHLGSTSQYNFSCAESILGSTSIYPLAEKKDAVLPLVTNPTQISKLKKKVEKAPNFVQIECFLRKW